MNLDIFKLIVVLIALFYLNLKIKPHINSTNYRIMNIGLCLLLFASVLDFTDGFKSLKYFPILGKKGYLHGILEDQFGDIPGLALFILGTFREILRKNK